MRQTKDRHRDRRRQAVTDKKAACKKIGCEQLFTMPFTILTARALTES